MFKLTGTIAAALMLTAVGASAGSEAKIYPFAFSHNYCPAGLQPVSINGTVSCGTPNQHITYQQALAHPGAVHKPRVTHQPRHTSRSARADCQIGTKGCTFD